jgi:hypothetical protein
MCSSDKPSPNSFPKENFSRIKKKTYRFLKGFALGKIFRHVSY